MGGWTAFAAPSPGPGVDHPSVQDVEHEASPAEVESLVVAARWAPSAGNSQPWAFIVGRRGDDVHRRMCRYLTPGSAAWAPAAALLVANLCLGQAIAHLTFQAQWLGLAVRQFAAFDRTGLSGEFAVPEHWQVMTMSAIGRVPAGHRPHALIRPDGAVLPRVRRTVADLLWDPDAVHD